MGLDMRTYYVFTDLPKHLEIRVEASRIDPKTKQEFNMIVRIPPRKGFVKSGRIKLTEIKISGTYIASRVIFKSGGTRAGISQYVEWSPLNVSLSRCNTHSIDFSMRSLGVTGDPMNLKSQIKWIIFVFVFGFISDSYASEKPVDKVIDWAVNRMSKWSPPGRKSYIPEATETEEEATTRYASIASDALTIAFDPSEKPIFGGSQGRLRTFSLLISVAHSESGFRKDVDFGLGKYAKGDGGRSWCLGQIQLGKASDGKTKTRVLLTEGGGLKYVWDGTGLGGEDLVSDRKNCFRVSLRIMRLSFNSCSALPISKRLAVYASGSCDKGHDSSSARVGKAIRWLSIDPAPVEDSEVTHQMFPEDGDIGEPMASIGTIFQLGRRECRI